MLIEKIKSDLDLVRKIKDKNDFNRIQLTLLSTLYSEASRIGKDKDNRISNDEETLSVVKKFIKNANLTISELKKVNRDYSELEQELSILNSYLPIQDEDSITKEKLIEFLTKLKEQEKDIPDGKAAFGFYIKKVKEEYGDKFDGSQMSGVIKEFLNA